MNISEQEFHPQSPKAAILQSHDALAKLEVFISMDMIH